MLAEEFDFDLPSRLIAQTPAEPRDSARLLHLICNTGAISHHRFSDLPALLRPDDLLVLNDTRVLRARLRGYKMSASGERGARVEALLLREIEPNLWQALLRPSAHLRPGTELHFFSPDEKVCIRAHPVERTESDWMLRFTTDQFADVRDALPFLGEVPLPPYIAPEANAGSDVASDYQTIYARRDTALESAAAPTAGLHFTPEVFGALRARGIRTAQVTLGIGIGTFRPISSDTIEEHAMHAEDYEISGIAAHVINEQKARGGRVVAVGTTATRVLESAALEKGSVKAGAGRTSIYIRPGHRFRAIDALITNFHLPRSTLLVMLSALAQDKMEHPDDSSELTGVNQIRYAYNAAIAEGYRFFSFGDAMLIE